MSPHPLIKNLLIQKFEIQKYYQNKPEFHSVSSRKNLPKSEVFVINPGQ